MCIGDYTITVWYNVYRIIQLQYGTKDISVSSPNVRIIILISECLKEQIDTCTNVQSFKHYKELKVCTCTYT